MNIRLSSGLLVLLLLGVLVAVSATAAAENHNNLTIEDQGLEDGAVTVENVSTAQQSTIVVAYRDDDATVVAGLADADNLDGATVQVDIEDDGGFPGEHSALLFNDTDVDGVGIGDDVAQITDRALAADAALVSVDVTGDGVPARDVTGNGTLNDIDGDTDLDILDVQALFDNLDEPSVQDNAQLFDFDGDDRVSIFDVQALFTQFRTPFASLNISEQATASSTFTAENATTPGVRVTDVRSNVDSAVVVTYEQGGELVVAGLETFEQPELAGDDVVVPVEDTGGFPGEHTAHVIPTNELSSQYEPGDTVSGATAAAVLDSGTATVFQGTVGLANQTVVGAAGDGDLTVNASLAGDSNTLYAINLHEATDAGAPGSFVGATDVISGTTEGVELRLENPSGETVTIEGTGEFIAMIHVVDDDSVEEGDSFPPAAFPVLPHTDATGPVPGGVTDDATVTVLEPANFSVGITGTNTPVEGETLSVETTVTNTGDVEATQNITLDVGPLGTNVTALTLSSGESQNLTLSIGTDAGDAGEYNATVSSENDSASANVTVQAPADFSVGITGTNTPVEGERLKITAEVQNTGAVENTQTINLSVGPLGTNSTEVTLPGGESTNVTLSVGTGAGDAGEYTATVSSGNNSASANVTVLTPGSLSVSITGTNTPVEGERLNVTAEVQNTGAVEDTQSISLDVGPLGTNSTEITLSGGASTSVTLSVGTGTGDAGEYTATVSSANDTDSEGVTVLAPAEFTVDIVEASNVPEGEQLDVVTEVENVGDVADTQSIELDVGPLGTDSTTVQLGGGASTQVTLSVGTSSGDAGEYTATVSSADDSATASVTVLEPAFFQVSTLDPENATVDEREAFNVSATVENTGEVMSTQTVELRLEPDGAAVTNQTLTLAGGSSTTVTFESVTVEDPGEYNHTVVTENDQVSGNLTVRDLPAGNFSVDFVGQTNETVAGEQQTFDVRVNNTGTERALQEIEFDWGNGSYNASEFVALNASESTVTTFTVQTDSDEFLGRYDVEVSSLNETDTTRARINPERTIENAEVAPGGTVNVTVTGELGGNLNFTLVETYEPPVNDSEIDFEGTSFNPFFQDFNSDFGIASFEEKGPGPLNIAYEIVLPANASSGDEFGYDEQNTAFELGGVQFDIGGDDTITVVSGAGVRSMSFAPV